MFGAPFEFTPKAQSLRSFAREAESDAVYKVSLADHLAALQSTEILAGLVLVQSWSLAEALARIALQEDELSRVENRAPAALAINFQGVRRVHGGLAGPVESYVIRNAVAHGSKSWNKRMTGRVAQAGRTAHCQGDRLDLSDTALQECRSSVRSLMRLMGPSARGTKSSGAPS